MFGPLSEAALTQRCESKERAKQRPSHLTVVFASDTSIKRWNKE